MKGVDNMCQLIAVYKDDEYYYIVQVRMLSEDNE